MTPDIPRSDIHRVRAVFTDAETERRYRDYRKADDLFLAGVGLLAVVAAQVFFVAVDFQSPTRQAPFGVLVAARAGLAAAAALTYAAIRHQDDMAAVDRIIALFAVLLISAAPVVQTMRGAGPTMILPIIVLMTLGIYLLMPGAFLRLCVLGVYANVAIAGTAIYHGLGTSDMLLVIATALLSNIFGVAASYRLQLSERRQFAARLDLQRALAKVEASERAQATFVAMLSHDLRNHLNGIVGLGRVMLSEEDDAAWRRRARAIAESSRNLIRLLDDAFDALRARRAEFKIENAEFDLGPVVADVLAPLRTRAESKGLRFDVAIAPSVPARVIGDEFRVAQILGNLVGNAVQFTPRGRVSVEVSTEDENAKSIRIRFAIADNGPPLTEAEIRDLFAPALQEGAERTTGARSAGISLHIAKVLIERMGGTIGVTSCPDTGTRFAADIPFRTARRGAAPKTVAVENSTRALAILSIDDSPVNTEILETLLRRFGHVVASAYDGNAALRLARARAFDLALIDLRMPGMSGEELARALRNDREVLAQGPAPLAVAVTAETLGRAPDNFDGVLTKPVDPAELHRLIELALRRPNASAASAISATEADAVDWERLSDLKCDLERDGLARILTIGKSFVERSLEQLAANIDSRDKSETSASAHALKGAAANIGLKSVAETALAMERLAESGEFAEAGRRLAALRTTTPRALAAVDAWMDRQR